MPVPRLFEASPEPREQWVHVIATLLALGGPQTRTALIEEISGEALPGADALLVREQRPLPDGTVADVVVRGAGWTLVLDSTLGFDADITARLQAVHDAVAATAKDQVIVVAITPDRRPSAAVSAAAEGRTVRHRSWLRVRDWVQERPERGRAEGTDLVLLREAEYFFTPRVAELYRLEGLMPLVSAELRPALSDLFFDLNDLSPAPRIVNEAGAARVVFPRTGDAQVEVAVGDGRLSVRVRAAGGPGFVSGAEGWHHLDVISADHHTAARSWLRTAARELLPARR